MPSGLSSARMKKLTAAMQTLPAQLQYLKPSILSLATQDQDLLGCGESDCSVFDAAWKQESAGCEPGADMDLAASHLEALQEWASKAGDENSAWLGPVWFLTGSFQAPAFGDSCGKQATDEPDPPGIVAVDIPHNFSSRDIGNGWSITDDRVWIILQSICQTDFQQMNAGLIARASESPLALIDESLISEGHTHHCDASFTQYGASGVRYRETVDSSGVTFAARYCLSVPGGNVQLLISSATDDGFDPAEYEPLIKSIRVSPARKPE